MHPSAKLLDAGKHVLQRLSRPRVLDFLEVIRSVNQPQHSTMVDLAADGPPPAKKVRVACRRCRTKRVKVRVWPGHNWYYLQTD